MLKYFLYAAVPAVLALATFVWLIVALVRQCKSWRIAVGVFGVEILLLAIGYFVYFTPVEYPRTYLDEPAPETGSLAEIAREKSFYIGAAVNMADNPAYRKLVPSEYNSITPENYTKWRQLLANEAIGNYDFSKADAIVDYAVENGVRVRGHTLIWGKFSGRTYPKELDNLIAEAADPPAELRRIMQEHIQTVMTHFKGRITVWDVVNEPLSMDGVYLDENIFLNTLGRSYIAESFRMAREADPSAQLFINEQFGNYAGELVELFFDLLEWLLEENVPIDGVGIQAHNIFKTHNLDEFRQFVQRVADLGLLVEVTEFDARIRLFGEEPDPYQAQGDYMAEYARICIENPACIGFTVWGLSDASTWFDWVTPVNRMLPNDPLLFNVNLRPKPAYTKIRESLRNRP